MNHFEDLFREMIQFAGETKVLLSEEKGVEEFKQTLEDVIEELSFLLNQPTSEITSENIPQVTQLIETLKKTFEEIADFFSNAQETLSVNQKAIQAYMHQALEHF